MADEAKKDQSQLVAGRLGRPDAAAPGGKSSYGTSRLGLSMEDAVEPAQPQTAPARPARPAGTPAPIFAFDPAVAWADAPKAPASQPTTKAPPQAAPNPFDRPAPIAASHEASDEAALQDTHTHGLVPAAIAFLQAHKIASAAGAGAMLVLLVGILIFSRGGTTPQRAAGVPVAQSAQTPIKPHGKGTQQASPAPASPWQQEALTQTITQPSQFASGAWNDLTAPLRATLHHRWLASLATQPAGKPLAGASSASRPAGAVAAAPQAQVKPPVATTPPAPQAQSGGPQPAGVGADGRLTVSPAGFQLVGIIAGKNERYANINGQFVRAGQSIEGATVIKITASSVELEMEGMRFTIGAGTDGKPK